MTSDNEMNNQAAQTMPELPAPVFFAAPSEGYTADQMHQYARAYAAALSQTAGAKVAEIDGYLFTSDEVAQAMEVLRGRHGSTALIAEVLDEMQRCLLANADDEESA